MHPRLLVGTLATLSLSLAACPKNPTPDPFVDVALATAQQGSAVALIDFDGDGKADKLVGAPRALHDGHVGVLLVYRGLGGDAFTFRPVAALTGGDSFGHSLLQLSDLDGDGHAEYAVAAIHGDGDAAALTGVVTVHKGGKRGEVKARLSAGLPSAKFGWVMAAGDFDADGALDLAVGAPFNSPSADTFQRGSVFIFFGPDFSRRQALDSSGSVAGLGWALAAGDVNADGVADLLVGANGKVLVLFGRQGFAPAVTAPDVTVSGKATGFGRSLGGLSDRDGDSKPDFVIGAPTAASAAGRDTGAIYVVRGGALPAAIDVDATPPPAELLAALNGSAVYQRFGSSLGSVADLDGDGRPELVVGAPLSDGKALNDLTGRVYVFKSTLPLELTRASAFDGSSRGGRFGAAFSPAPGGRLLVGAPRADGDTGEVQLLDLATGKAVLSGSSGGADGETYCHCDEKGECHC